MEKRKYDSYGNQYYYRNKVADSRDLEEVAGAFDENFKVRVNAYIDGEVFCNAVRRCLLNDLVAGAMDEEDAKRRK